MLRTIIVAGAMLTALTVPSLAASNWNVLRPLSAALTQNDTRPCFVAARSAAPGEERIAGPYSSQSQADSAIAGQQACDLRSESFNR
jgi:hypothetical protein